MTAPRWIETALGEEIDAEWAAAELIKHLPIEAIAREVPGVLDDIADGMHGRVVADIVRVLTDGDPEVVQLAELHRERAAAIAAARAAENELGRVRHELAAECDAMRESHRAEHEEWAAARRDLEKRIERSALELSIELELARSMRDQLLDEMGSVLQELANSGAPDHAVLGSHIVIEATVGTGATEPASARTVPAQAVMLSPADRVRFLAAEARERTLELEATRKMAAGAAEDLDRARRDHQAALDDAAATELRLTEATQEILGRLEAICHRLDDNDVHVDAASWIDHIEAGVGQLIAQRDGACERRDAAEQQRLKDEAFAAFEAQRFDLAAAVGLAIATSWNDLVGAVTGLRTALDEARAKVGELEGEVERLDEAREAATGEAEHSDRELVDLRRRFDDLQRDRDRLARDLNVMQGDLDTAERKLRETERDLNRARHPGGY